VVLQDKKIYYDGDHNDTFAIAVVTLKSYLCLFGSFYIFLTSAFVFLLRYNQKVSTPAPFLTTTIQFKSATSKIDILHL
jgi:hypothetical protein